MQKIVEETRPKSSFFRFHIENTTTRGSSLLHKLHAHDYIEITYFTSGNYITTIDNKNYNCSPGDMCIIGSYQAHTNIATTFPEGEYIVLKFKPEMIYTNHYSPLELRYVIPLMFNTPNKQQYFSSSELADSGLDLIFNNIKSEIQEQRYGHEISIKSDLYKVILFFLRNSCNKNSPSLSILPNTMTKIETAITYIENNFSLDLNVKEIAEICYMEYTYFSKIFKKITAMSCTDYIHNIRIRESEKFLVSTDLSITDIASRIGYNNTSYFIKNFQKIKGIAPRRYREILRNS